MVSQSQKNGSSTTSSKAFLSQSATTTECENIHLPWGKLPGTKPPEPKCLWQYPDTESHALGEDCLSQNYAEEKNKTPWSSLENTQEEIELENVVFSEEEEVPMDLNSHAPSLDEESEEDACSPIPKPISFVSTKYEKYADALVAHIHVEEKTFTTKLGHLDKIADSLDFLLVTVYEFVYTKTTENNHSFNRSIQVDLRRKCCANMNICLNYFNALHTASPLQKNEARDKHDIRYHYNYKDQLKVFKKKYPHIKIMLSIDRFDVEAFKKAFSFYPKDEFYNPIEIGYHGLNFESTLSREMFGYYQTHLLPRKEGYKQFKFDGLHIETSYCDLKSTDYLRPLVKMMHGLLEPLDRLITVGIKMDSCLPSEDKNFKLLLSQVDAVFTSSQFQIGTTFLC